MPATGILPHAFPAQAIQANKTHESSGPDDTAERDEGDDCDHIDEYHDEQAFQVVVALFYRVRCKKFAKATFPAFTFLNFRRAQAPLR